ncbi:MAG: hypothetical protein UY95_C0012G0007 [Parcubacteria group bacterium GW2011_GWA2_56_7]|nr:MAG: hypothetical protein UY95_C0012G0007 [Parcubacteria group bacterium GW2011_GWA2_56_7]
MIMTTYEMRHKNPAIRSRSLLTTGGGQSDPSFGTEFWGSANSISKANG